LRESHVAPREIKSTAVREFIATKGDLAATPQNDVVAEFTNVERSPMLTKDEPNRDGTLFADRPTIPSRQRAEGESETDNDRDDANSGIHDAFRDQGDTDDQQCRLVTTNADPTGLGV
jgi:hypothetical protein